MYTRCLQFLINFHTLAVTAAPPYEALFAHNPSCNKIWIRLPVWQILNVTRYHRHTTPLFFIKLGTHDASLALSSHNYKKHYPDGSVNSVILHVIRHCWLASITVQRWCVGVWLAQREPTSLAGGQHEVVVNFKSVFPNPFSKNGDEAMLPFAP